MMLHFLWEPQNAPSEPWGTKGEPKELPRGAKGNPRASKRVPKKPPRGLKEPQGIPKGAKGAPEGPRNPQRPKLYIQTPDQPPQNGGQLVYMYVIDVRLFRQMYF